MNKFIQVCLGTLGVMASAGWAGDAQADIPHRFIQIGGIKTLAAATDGTGVYALDANDFLSGSGYHIRTWGTGSRWLPPHSLDGRGTSLAVDSLTNRLYTVSLDNHVWGKQMEIGPSGWTRFPRTRCEGGNLTPRQVVGQNNVSSYNSNTYVISGSRVYYWQNASCWFKLPALPSGDPVEIAQAGQNPAQIWALNASMQIFHFDGATWRRMTGIAQGAGYRVVIGSDGRSVWNWNPTDGFTPETQWTHGAISQVQKSQGSGTDNYAVVQPGGELWWFGQQT